MGKLFRISVTLAAVVSSRCLVQARRSTGEFEVLGATGTDRQARLRASSSAQAADSSDAQGEAVALSPAEAEAEEEREEALGPVESASSGPAYGPGLVLADTTSSRGGGEFSIAGGSSYTVGGTATPSGIMTEAAPAESDTAAVAEGVGGELAQGMAAASDESDDAVQGASDTSSPAAAEDSEEQATMLVASPSPASEPMSPAPAAPLEAPLEEVEDAAEEDPVPPTEEEEPPPPTEEDPLPPTELPSAGDIAGEMVSGATKAADEAAVQAEKDAAEAAEQAEKDAANAAKEAEKGAAEAQKQRKELDHAADRAEAAANNEPEPTTTTTTTTTGEPKKDVQMDMIVENVDYANLAANPVLVEEFKSKIKIGVARVCGSHYDEENVDVVLAAGSVKATVLVHTKPENTEQEIMERLQNPDVAEEVRSRLAQIEGIDQATTGRMQIGSMSEPAAVEPTTTTTTLDLSKTGEFQAQEHCTPACMAGRGICNDRVCFCKTPYMGVQCEKKLDTGLWRFSYAVVAALVVISMIIGVISASLVFKITTSTHHQFEAFGQSQVRKETWKPAESAGKK